MWGWKGDAGLLSGNTAALLAAFHTVHTHVPQVFGPVAAELSCTRPELAGYVEAQVGSNLYHFVVSSR